MTLPCIVIAVQESLAFKSGYEGELHPRRFMQFIYPAVLWQQKK